jgi:hypothetical protein
MTLGGLMSKKLLNLTMHTAILLALSLSAFAALATEAVITDSQIKMITPVGTAPLDTADFLKAFHANPREVMHMRPAKRDEAGRVLDLMAVHVYSSKNDAKAAIIHRDEIRKQLCTRSGIDCEGPNTDDGTVPESAPDNKNTIEGFTTVPVANIIRNPMEMEARGLRSHVLANSPWSDSFWPVTRGFVARRYADGGFPNSPDWSANYNYIQSRPAWTVGTDQMSPAEKYDYLVGDSSWRLTGRAWGKGTRYIQQYGFVPSWVGLCHGWAPASLMTPMPVRSITVPAHNGSSVTFYPSDVKALASVLWGEAPPIVRFAGARCKKFNPREDDVGRITTEGCYDVNPGTFHMAMVNELGQQHRGVVMDSTFDFEVWNYPIAAYSYRYFNPQTLAVSDTIVGSRVPMNRFTIDKFKQYRSPNGRFIVGVAMDVTYASVLQPSTKVISKQKYHTVRYVYDLELDASNNIIGGEWYSNFHPDFLWNPPVKSRAMAAVEKAALEPVNWDGQSPISSTIHNMAVKASSRGEPLAVVVERLVQMASIPDETTPVLAPVDTHHRVDQ